MHLSRNFAWSLDLSDREFRVLLRALRNDELSSEEVSLVDKLIDVLTTNAARLERISTGKSRDLRDEKERS
jgi:hypothetical protein